MSQSVHSGPKFKAVILNDWYDVLGLHFASSRMWQLSTYFEEGSMLESVGINSSKDSLDQFQSQMDSNAIYYFEFQTWDQALHPAQNRSKLTIQLLWCSNQTIQVTFPTLYQHSIQEQHALNAIYMLVSPHYILERIGLSFHTKVWLPTPSSWDFPWRSSYPRYNQKRS